jgi:hypothetical protein
MVLVLLVAVGWALQHLRTGSAEEQLAVEKTHTTQLAGQTAELAPVRAFVTTVDQQKVLARDTMRGEVYLSRVLGGIKRATPPGATVDGLAVTVAPPADSAEAEAAAVAAGDEATAACPGPDPFNTRETIGCVTLSGSAGSRQAVGALVVSLGDDPMFVEPFISTTTTADGEGLVFTGTVGLSTKAFSGRYAKMDALLTKETR